MSIYAILLILYTGLGAWFGWVIYKAPLIEADDE